MFVDKQRKAKPSRPGNMYSMKGGKTNEIKREIPIQNYVRCIRYALIFRSLDHDLIRVLVDTNTYR